MPPPPKTDGPAAQPPPAKTEKPAPAPEAAAAAAPAVAVGGIRAWLPAIVSIVVAPAVTWAAVEFVVVPRLQKKLDVHASAAAAAEDAGAATENGKDGKAKGPSTYDGFQNVVVNLAGTMGTRYLKTSFVVVGDPKGTVDIKKVFEENRTKLYDTTLNVLSSLTLADLEEAGAKNVIREKLVGAYNQALNKRVAEQVYFSDFVVQ